MALKYCNRGVTLSELQFGSLGHHLLLAQRAYLFCQMGRTKEAWIDFDFLQNTNYGEVMDTLEMIRPLLGNEKISARSRTRSLRSADPLYSLSVLEEKLISFLEKGAKDRIDILNHMYGTQLSFDAKLSRFKNLLSTLRRKAPQLLKQQEDENTYALEEIVAVVERPDLNRAD